MSITGVLEDLPLADVLQFVHLGRRSGVLYVWQREDWRAEVGFHDGRIIFARAPGQRKLGDLLVASGSLTEAELADALQRQSRDETPITLGQILLTDGAVSRENLESVLRSQIEETVFELVTWKNGQFDFEVDSLAPIDELAVVPREILESLDLDTQMLLLEATRLFDERGQKATGHEIDEVGPRVLVPQTPTQTIETVRCQILSTDEQLVVGLREEMADDPVLITMVTARELGNRVPGETGAPIVILDLRRPPASIEDLSIVTRMRPAAPVVALVDNRDETNRARSAGAIMVIDPSRESVADCCRNLVRLARVPQARGYRDLAGFGRFRRVLFDFQSGLSTGTMALNLLHVISESVERAVLFLVRNESLVAVGAFGFSNSGRSLAEATQRLKLELSASGPLETAYMSGMPMSLELSEVPLPEPLGSVLGPPGNRRYVVFPVLGASGPIALIYTDNGERPELIEDIRILELATSQVGVALENELLKQDPGSPFRRRD